ncbi:MAG: IS110 family transposase, partial [Mycobacterium sp.]
MTTITEVAVRQQVWAGVDAGKADHYCVVVDVEGQRLLSQRVANDETTLRELIDTVTDLADGGEVTWAIDLNAGGAASCVQGSGVRAGEDGGRVV